MNPVREEFRVHLMNSAGLARAEAIAKAFGDLLSTVEEMAPGSGREVALCRTKLQEACFWAKRALAVMPENEQAESL